MCFAEMTMNKPCSVYLSFDGARVLLVCVLTFAILFLSPVFTYHCTCQKLFSADCAVTVIRRLDTDMFFRVLAVFS